MPAFHHKNLQGYCNFGDFFISLHQIQVKNGYKEEKETDIN